MEKFAVVGGKALRRGYTTGSCATATATAATEMLLTGRQIAVVDIVLPSGDKVSFDLEDMVITDEFASCSTVKDGGDDPDATHGAKIFAKVSFPSKDSLTESAASSSKDSLTESVASPAKDSLTESAVSPAKDSLTESAVSPSKDSLTESVASPAKDSLTESITPLITIKGGKGVGTVTTKGLQIPPGEPAINPVPRKMIRENVTRILAQHNGNKSIEVEISVPKGEEIAKKTFNLRMGIVGGISILGTTGIVEPMSEKALVDTFKSVIDQQYAQDPGHILISPGNYGKDFCRDYLNLDIEKSVQVSNFVGECLDYIKYKGFKQILFVGHTGKLVKLAAGIMNTHSAYADARMEIIGIYSALSGADIETLNRIMDCVTTDDAFDLIKDKPYYEEVKERILTRVMYHLNYRLKGEAEIEVVMYTNDRKHIIKSSGADSLIEYFGEDN